LLLAQLVLIANFIHLVWLFVQIKKTQDFIFVFRALQEGIQKLSLAEMNPDVLITDGADAIRQRWNR
jgi:hypothetical protein